MRGDTTLVGQCSVRVRSANIPTLYYFSSGAHGKKEMGVYAFWTTRLKRSRKVVIGRALACLPPGDRFDRVRGEMRNAKTKAVRDAYRRLWKVIGAGKRIAYIRPSTKREVVRWMDGHESDAKFAAPVRLPR